MKREEFEKYLTTLKVVDDQGLLDRNEEVKYNEFKSKDPFPEIKPALLNSADILKYVLFIGLISDFMCEDLLGATYNCRISGEFLCYNKEKQMYCRQANNDHDIKIEPNSITYVAIKNIFRVPDYLALRFNLRVSHVYKGLLLGTGPIIDPGFVGQIYIPLHNLTSNTYYIKPGAPLISVEFTKLSTHSSWAVDTSNYAELLKEIRGAEYIHKDITPFRTLYGYIDRALTEEDFYRDSNLPMSISNAVTDDIQNIKNDILAHEEKISDKLDDYQKSFEASGSKINGEIGKFQTTIDFIDKQIKDTVKRADSSETNIKQLTFFVLASVLIPFVALLCNTYIYGRDSMALREAINTIETQREEYAEMKRNYDQIIQSLQERVEILEMENDSKND